MDGAREVAPLGMDGVSHLKQGPRAPQNLSAKVWCKTPFILWTSVLVLGFKGTKGWCSRGGPSRDGWMSWPSGAGTWGTPELVRQIVVQSALYDVDIRFAIGVLRHQGMGLARWPL